MPTLKYKADVRSLLYLGSLFAVLALLWNTGFNAFGYALLLFFSMTMAVVAHNHSHGGMFEQKWANKTMDYLVSMAYGNPIFAWTPTHAQNHHIYANREGDEAISWRWTAKNTWWMALLYYPMCAYYQTKLVNPQPGPPLEDAPQGLLHHHQRARRLLRLHGRALLHRLAQGHPLRAHPPAVLPVVRALLQLRAARGL